MLLALFSVMLFSLSSCCDPDDDFFGGSSSQTEVAVSEITFNQTTLELTEGGTGKLVVSVYPSNATNKQVTYESSDPTVATVDGEGNVTAVGPGTATITGTSGNGEKKTTCVVTVKPNNIGVTGISFERGEYALPDGGTMKLVVIFSPDNATDKGVTFSSSDPAVATVDGEGNVTAVAPGTATVTASTTDGEKKATCIIAVLSGASGSVNGHDYVDLGLPSGTLWATCNVGATSPADYGDYFAWGETTTKDWYTWENYKWLAGENLKWSKYVTESWYGEVDNKTVLEPEDDAATANWGAEWRMYTNEDMKELVENCVISYTSRLNSKGEMINGHSLVSKVNGAEVFLPAGGRFYESALEGVGTGYYWTSNTDVKDYISVLKLNPTISNLGKYYYYELFNRFGGLSVRPVCKIANE